jgi:hypothetical protein
MAIFLMRHIHQALPICFFGYIGVVEDHVRRHGCRYALTTLLIDVCDDDGCAFAGEAGGDAFSIARTTS